MKKSLFVLLALAFCLSACAPAASGSEETFNGTVENVQTPETAAEQTALPPVGDLTMNINAREDDTGYYSTGVWENPETGEPRLVLYRLDYPTGQQKILYDFGSYDSGEIFVSDPFVQKDAVYVQENDSLCRLPLDGGEMEILPTKEAIGVGFSDENALYQVTNNLFMDLAQPPVQRVDLQTGAVTQWELPPMYISAINDCRGNRVLISRVITDQPLPSLEENELFDAVLQNSTMEYDWLDIITGDLQKIMAYPYKGETDEKGQKTQWTYEGMGEDALYFFRTVTDAQGKRVSASIDRCALDGSNMETVMPVNTSNTLYPVNRGGQLAWLLDYDYTGPATIYDLEQGKVYENIPVQGNDSGWPFILTNDGRVLVNDHYDGAQPTYALINQDDYLAGSRDWTLFTEMEN